MLKIHSDSESTSDLRDLFNSTETKEYLCVYMHEGKQRSAHIKATSFEDAEKRLKNLQRGKVLGEIKAKIPLYPRWMERLFKHLMS